MKKIYNFINGTEMLHLYGTYEQVKYVEKIFLFFNKHLNWDIGDSWKTDIPYRRQLPFFTEACLSLIGLRWGMSVSHGSPICLRYPWYLFLHFYRHMNHRVLPQWPCTHCTRQKKRSSWVLCVVYFYSIFVNCLYLYHKRTAANFQFSNSLLL